MMSPLYFDWLIYYCNSKSTFKMAPAIIFTIKFNRIYLFIVLFVNLRMVLRMVYKHFLYAHSYVFWFIDFCLKSTWFAVLALSFKIADFKGCDNCAFYWTSLATFIIDKKGPRSKNLYLNQLIIKTTHN